MRQGEFEFPNPIAAAEFMVMPRRIDNIEQNVQTILDSLNQLKNTEVNDSIERTESKTNE